MTKIKIVLDSDKIKQIISEYLDREVVANRYVSAQEIKLSIDWQRYSEISAEWESNEQ